MKIKNLVMNLLHLNLGEEVNSMLFKTSLFLLCSSISIGYYSSEKQTQITESQSDIPVTFVDEEGQTYCIFDEGEHKIMISRNDLFYHQIEAVDGYAIEDVVVNSWRDNNQVTYVNTESVVVLGTLNKEGVLTFENFGQVISNSKKIDLK